MVYIYVPAAYYHLNLDVTKENLLAAGFSAVPAVFLVKFQQATLLENFSVLAIYLSTNLSPSLFSS